MMLSRKQKIISVVVVVAIIVILVRLFIFESFFVSGDSMAPTILSGDLVFVDKMAYWFHQPARGDIIVVVPRVYDGNIIKRVIALPGEIFDIENGKIVIKQSRDDVGITLDESYLMVSTTPEIGTTLYNVDPDEYFVLGDNRDVSIDSRELGPVDLWSIKGKVFLIFSFIRMRFIKV
ncbi:MAG TPA: signal peptidase I [Candidatus Paceibacterota bacterium]|nr:signal peptidase I [Candidatus Paceibacterota bacterium]